MKIVILICTLFFSFSLFAQTTDQISNQETAAAVDLYPIQKIPVPDSVKIPVLDFKNTDICDVLRGLGMQYNVNIFLEPDVSGNVSLYLTDVSVKNAIDFIVKRSNFVYSVENGIVKVYKYNAPPNGLISAIRSKDGSKRHSYSAHYHFRLFFPYLPSPCPDCIFIYSNFYSFGVLSPEVIL